MTTLGYHQAYVISEGESRGAFEGIRKSVLPGLYEHWKSTEEGPKFYIAYGATTLLGTHLSLVPCVALYRPHAGILTSRHLLDEEDGFLMPINRDEYSGPRFKLMCELSGIGIAVLLQYAGELCVARNRTKFLGHAAVLLDRRPGDFL